MTFYVPPKKHPPTNYPRDVIMRMAGEAINNNGGPQHARVHFKFTCQNCGTRCTFSEPNQLFERGECCNCGFDNVVLEAGFSLEISALGFQT